MIGSMTRVELSGESKVNPLSCGSQGLSFPILS
jgi:hypothetical protein